jgi:hypothetical protein
MSSIAHATDDPMSAVGRFLLGLCICRKILQITDKNALYIAKMALLCQKCACNAKRKLHLLKKSSAMLTS